MTASVRRAWQDRIDGSRILRRPLRADRCPAPAALAPAPPPPEPCTPAELRALVLGGENESDACEKVLAQVARIEAALDLAIGDGLAALTVGTRLIRLGFSSLRDDAREVLHIQERTAESMVRLSRELRTRPVLRAAVRAGEVRLRKAQTVLPVAIGDAEAAWTERAKREIEAWVPKAKGLTCIALANALDARDEAQTRAARTLRARVPVRIVLLPRRPSGRCGRPKDASCPTDSASSGWPGTSSRRGGRT